jgi:hypothetical protein
MFIKCNKAEEIYNMKIHIAPSRLISDIQREFNEEFPFLKLEFFRNGITGVEKSVPANRLQGSLPVGFGQPIKIEGDLVFSESTKVKELENNLREGFHLNAQVFRRSGNIWLETTMTDKWTLKQQNEHGKEISGGGNGEW